MMNARTGANSKDMTALALLIVVDWIAFLSRVVQATHIPEDVNAPLLRPILWFIRVGSADIPRHEIQSISRRSVESTHRMFALILKNMGTTSTFISFILLFPILNLCDSTGVMYEAVFPQKWTSLLFMFIMFANDLTQDLAVHIYATYYFKLGASMGVTFSSLTSMWFMQHVILHLSAVLWMPAIMNWLIWYFASNESDS